MSQDFHYANHDRAEYFDAGFRAGSSASVAIGHGWGARALGLLIWDGAGDPPDPVAGRWRRQRISAQSDYRIEANDPPHDQLSIWTDLFADVFLMLARVDRCEFLPFVFSDSYLCFVAEELVLNHGADWLEHAIVAARGNEWRMKHYEVVDPLWQRSYAVPPLQEPDLVSTR